MNETAQNTGGSSASVSRIAWFAGALLVAAMVIAAYLGSISWRHGSVMGCGVDSPCEAVLVSRWAYWFGLPVSFLALPIYAGLVVTGLRGSKVADALAMAVILAGVWFAGLQAVVIRNFCPWCVATHLLAATAAILIWRTGRAAAPKIPATDGRPLVRTMATALVLLVILIGGQLAPRRTTHAVRVLEGGTGVSGRMLKVHQFEYPLGDLAIDGKADAKHLIVYLFDYTCPHCRHNHAFLEQARTRFGPDLAIVYLPVPMERRCNKFIEMTTKMHEGACDYAKLGMAVWKCEPGRFAEFNHWLFAPEKPPSLIEARTRAAGFVPPQTLLNALVDKWPGQQIERGLAVFEANLRAMQQDELPQIMVGSVVSFGEIKEGETLYRLIEQQFELKRLSN